jgi:hypothetical protein
MKKTISNFDSAAAEALIGILKSAGNMIRDKLRERLAAAGYEMSDRSLRLLKEHINETRPESIGSTSDKRGYFLITAAETFELDERQIERQQQDLYFKKLKKREKFKRTNPKEYARYMDRKRKTTEDRSGQTRLLFRETTEITGGETWTSQ